MTSNYAIDAKHYASMRATPTSLMPLRRSNAVGKLLAWLFLNPENEYSTTELAARTGASQSSVSHKADRFLAAGLTKVRRGNSRLVRADTNTIVAKPLTDLLAVIVRHGHLMTHRRTVAGSP